MTIPGYSEDICYCHQSLKGVGPQVSSKLYLPLHQEVRNQPQRISHRDSSFEDEVSKLSNNNKAYFH